MEVHTTSHCVKAGITNVVSMSARAPILAFSGSHRVPPAVEIKVA